MPRAPGQDILIDTAAGTPIPNSQAAILLYPLAAQALAAAVQFPSRLRANAHPRFNCHGLTFGCRRAAILNDAEVNQILQEDGYQQVAAADILPGDVAIYVSPEGSIDHSAIVASFPTPPGNVPFVFSKWGAHGPEVYHLATDTTPGYAVANIHYYRVIL